MGVTIGPLHVRRSAFIQATPARAWQEFGCRLHRAVGLGLPAVGPGGRACTVRATTAVGPRVRGHTQKLDKALTD